MLQEEVNKDLETRASSWKSGLKVTCPFPDLLSLATILCVNILTHTRTRARALKATTREVWPQGDMGICRCFASIQRFSHVDL